MSRIENMVNVVVLANPNGGYDARVTFVDGGVGQATDLTPEKAMAAATSLAILDRQHLADKTDHILALSAGLSPGALRHVSNHYYRLASEAQEKLKNGVHLPVPVAE